MTEFKLKSREEYISAFKRAVERKNECIRKAQKEFSEMRNHQFATIAE